MSQTVRYVLDVEAAAAEASVRKAADAIDDAAEAAAKASAEAAKYKSITAVLTREEKELAAKIIGTNAALEAKAKALGLTTAETARLNAAVKSSAPGMSGSAAAMNGLAGASNNAQRGLSSVAMQMPDVIAQISAGTPPLRALTQQGLQVVQSMDMMTLASKAFSPAGAAVAAVALSLGAAWAYLSYELTQAEEKMARQATMAGKLGDAHTKLEDLVSQAASELALATGQTDKATEAAKAREAAIRSAAAAERDALDGIVSTAKQELAAAVGTEARVAALARVERAESQREAALAGVARREAEAIQQTQDLAEYQRELAESNEELARRDRAAAEAAKGRAASEREKAEALREAAKAAEAMAKADRAAAAMAAIPNIANRDTRGQFADIGAIEARMRAEIASMSFAAPTVGQQLGAGAGTLAGAGSQLLTGAMNPLALVGGPVGQSLAMLGTLGEQGADKIVEQISEAAIHIGEGIGQLPELFAGVLYDLPEAIGEAVAEALQGLLPGGKGSGFTPFSGGLNLRDVLGIGTLGLSELAITPLVKLLQGATGSDVGGSAGYAVGDQRYISRTGMALVHEGERVVRSNGGGSSVTRAAAGQGGGYMGPPVIIQAAAVAPDVLSGLSDVVSAAYNPDGWGRGTRAVFGGG